MREKIVITSIGIISALGQGVDENLNSLRNARPGLKHPERLSTVHAPDFLMGEISLSNEEMTVTLGLPKGKNGVTRTCMLGMLAMRELLESVDINLLRNERFAFINANTVGGMCSAENMYFDLIDPDKPEGDFLKYIDTLDCAESTLNICKYFGLKPFTATISTACSSSANALLLGARMIEHGLVKRAICGGCDALSRYTLNGFNSLKNVDRDPCKPFDQNRNGLNLGEGAGYILIELESAAKERGAHIIAYLGGYGNSNDAYHPTAPSPDGAGAHRTMQQALEKAGLAAEQIGYINAHGTATQNNDAAEGKAIEQLFGNNIPFSSTKPYTGHTLAAAGVIEAIFSIWALQHQSVWPNLNFETPMEDLTIQPASALRENVTINHTLSNSFGFGGNNVSLIFSKA